MHGAAVPEVRVKQCTMNKKSLRRRPCALLGTGVRSLAPSGQGWSVPQAGIELSSEPAAGDTSHAFTRGLLGGEVWDIVCGHIANKASTCSACASSGAPLSIAFKCEV
jgi:hypothetical protein